MDSTVQPDGVLVTNGRLIDGRGGQPADNMDVLCIGDEIRAIGPTGTLSGNVPDGTLLIDATGQTIMPGLIDAHCHITFDDVQSNDELFFHRHPVTAALATVYNLPKLLRAGVTGFLDPDTVHGIGPEVRDMVHAGAFPGPRISTGSQALLTAVGGTAGRLIPDEGRVGYAMVVNTIDEMVTTTRRQIKHGADWIKIHATGSIPTRTGELQVWTLNELKAVCDTAHDLGVPVTAHCRSASSTRDAARAGVDVILHASYMDDEALGAVVEAGSSLCPTFTFLANLADYGERIGAGIGMADVFRGEISATAHVMRKAYDAGVPIMCGSESGFALTPYGEWHAREMEVLVQALGLSNLEAITCATKNNARALRLDGQIGTIETGRLADVLVIDGDPSSDVRVLQDKSNIKVVISRGRKVDTTSPLPQRKRVPGEKVSSWAEEVLTYNRAMGL